MSPGGGDFVDLTTGAVDSTPKIDLTGSQKLFAEVCML